MPSLSTLVDNFNGASIGPDWGNSYGGASQSGGLAHVPCTTGYAGFQTSYTWTLAGAAFFVKVVSVPAASTATEAYASVFVNAPGIGVTGGPEEGYRIGFVINTVTGLLRCKNDTGYFDAGSVDITYDPVAHLFLRLREDGTNVYWDTSPDGSTWTNRRTLATPAWVSADIDQCAIDLSAHRDAGTSDEVTYDLANTLSDGAVYTGSGSGTAETAASASGTRIAVASGSGAAQGAALAGGIGVHIGSGSGSAQSNATAATTLEYPEVASVAAGDFDLCIEQGSTFVQTYTVTDPGFTWSGWAARAQIRTSAAVDATLLLDLTPYLTVSGAAVQLAIPAAITATLTQNGRWDLEMYQGVIVVRILQGKVIISPEVTR
jgi:hypothetical protein